MSRDHEGHAGVVLMAFVMGAITGAAVALLWTPTTGEERRRFLNERAREGRGKVSVAAQRGREFVQQQRPAVAQRCAARRPIPLAPPTTSATRPSASMWRFPIRPGSHPSVIGEPAMKCVGEGSFGSPLGTPVSTRSRGLVAATTEARHHALAHKCSLYSATLPTERGRNLVPISRMRG